MGSPVGERAADADLRLWHGCGAAGWSDGQLRGRPHEPGCRSGGVSGLHSGDQGHCRRRILRQPGDLRRRRPGRLRSEEHTSELQSRENLVCRLLLEKKKTATIITVQSKMRTTWCFQYERLRMV